MMKSIFVRIVLVCLFIVLVAPSLSQADSTAKQIKRDGRFISYDDGTVLDTKTNLMWAAKDNGSDINWQDASRYGADYRGGGYKNWRMPTLEELTGLYDKSINSNNGCHITKLITLTQCRVWTSKSANPTGSSESLYGEYFSFADTESYWIPQTFYYGYRVLLVRSVK